jgi:phage host-nuclease inhibitor protein Gam
MSKRIKAPALKTRAEFDETVDRCVELQNKLDLLTARQARAQQRVLAAFALKMEPIETELKLRAAEAEKYADEHRAEIIPDKSKSAQTALGTFGYRTGNPTTKTLSKAWTWEKIIEALKASKLGAYLVNKPEVAKAKILADGKTGILTNAEGQPVALSAVGIKIDQGEVFYIEPKTDGTPTIKAEAA